MKKLLILPFFCLLFLHPAKANQSFFTEEQACTIDLATGEDEIVEALQHFRKEKRLAKVCEFTGFAMVMSGNVLVYTASTFLLAYPLVGLGTAAVLVGYAIEWNSLKHLKFEDAEKAEE